MKIKNILRIIIIKLLLYSVAESSSAKCYYYKTIWTTNGVDTYICEAKNNLNLETREIAVISSTSGNHSRTLDNSDVYGFYAENKNIKYFPRNLENIYTNLRGIAIFHGRLKEIDSMDLKPYPKLKELNLNNNDIEILDDSLFTFNPDLQFVEFAFNRIYFIGLKTFDGLKKLTYLKLEMNSCINENGMKTEDSKKIVSKVKTKCNNLNYLGVENELKKLEDSLVCVSSETSSIFEQKVKNLQSQFQKSTLAQPATLSGRLKEIESWKSKNVWSIKDSVDKIEKSMTSFKAEVTRKMEAIEKDITAINGPTTKPTKSMNDSVNDFSKMILNNISDNDKTIKNLQTKLSSYKSQKTSNIKQINDKVINMMKLLNSTAKGTKITNMEMTRTDLESSTHYKLNDIERNIVDGDAKSSDLYEIGKLIFIAIFGLFQIVVLTFVTYKMIL